MKPCGPNAVYVMASGQHGTLYIGVTSDLIDRISIHKQDIVDGFTKRYGVHLLVHYEHFDTMEQAIRREKQLKQWLRRDKIALIELHNPGWRDLYTEVSGLVDPNPVVMEFRPAVAEFMALIEEGRNWRSLPAGIAEEAMGNAYFRRSGGRSRSSSSRGSSSSACSW